VQVHGLVRDELHGSFGATPKLVRKSRNGLSSQLLERRRALRQDLLDEAEEGIYDMNAGPAARYAAGRPPARGAAGRGGAEPGLVPT
jgi:hypothetical protein